MSSSEGGKARRGTHKKTLDADSLRSKRQRNCVGIRRDERQENLGKRRQAALMQRQSQLGSSDAIAIKKRIFSTDLVGREVVTDSETLARLLELVSASYQDVQYEAAWAITNIASGAPGPTLKLIEAGAVEVLVRTLRTTTSDEVRNQVIWGLGNIAGEGADCRDKILTAGALPCVIEYLEHPGFQIQKNATWVVANLCRGTPSPAFALVKPAYPALARMMEHGDEALVADATWGMAYLADQTDDSQIDHVVDTGIVPKLIELTSRPGLCATPALRCLGNLLTGLDETTQRVLEYGVLPALLRLLMSNKKILRKEACWSLSNVLAGTPKQLDTCIEQNVPARLLYLIQNDTFEVKREAAWAVSNGIISGLPHQVEKFIEEGAIGALTGLLGFDESRVIRIALDGLTAILKHGLAKYGTPEENLYAATIDRLGATEILRLYFPHMIEPEVERPGDLHAEDNDMQLEDTSAQSLFTRFGFDAAE